MLKKQYSKYVIRLGLHKDTKLFSPSLRSFFSLLKKLYTLYDCTVIDFMYVTFTNKCVTSQKITQVVASARGDCLELMYIDQTVSFIYQKLTEMRV